MTERAGGPRIGLFGGTFNPIHLGHLRAAEEVREILALDRILFIPSAIPPHKRTDPKDPIAEAERRLQWTQRAIDVEKEFSVDRLEIDRPGPSFLVDTLETIRQREPTGTRIVFILGEDAFAEMGDWRAPERLFALADLAVMSRPPGRLRDLAQRMPQIVRDSFRFSQQGKVAQHREADTRIDLISITALDISSTEIRSAIRRGRSIRYLVPESIREEIECSGCYGPRSIDEKNG